MSEFEDEFIEIHGPMENSKLIECIEKEILNSSLANFIGEDKVETFLLSSLKRIQSCYDPLLGFPKESRILSKSKINDDPYAIGWIILGSLTNLNVREVVNDAIKDVISTAKPIVSVPSPEEKVILEGFGTYIYPPAWIGEIPKPKSFKEKLTSYLWEYYSERIISDVYKHCPLIITRDGYIAIGEKEKSKALEFLNEIMSTLLVLEMLVYIIRENDLGATSFKEKGIWKEWSLQSSRSWLYNRRLAEPSFLVFENIIPENKIRKAIKWSETLTSDDKFKTLLLLYLELYTHFMNSEYKQALVIGWVILEDFYLKDLWASHVSKVTSDKDRLSKLASWDADRKLEALNIAHIMTNKEYDLLMGIKDARNSTVHEGKEPRKDIVEECQKLVSKVIREYMGNKLGVVFPRL
ncbi:MAG: hypothetical protein H3Z53_06255 [archaeon]|nr:hypothetical protein [archaeon]MCP8313958.1 hypothetical protein [archaeon]